MKWKKYKINCYRIEKYNKMQIHLNERYFIYNMYLDMFLHDDSFCDVEINEREGGRSLILWLYLTPLILDDDRF